MDKLPNDIIKLIILKLPIKDIFNFIILSKRYYKITNDIKFWEKIFKFKIKGKINISNDVTIKWYKYKLSQYPKIRKMMELKEQGNVSIEFDIPFSKKWSSLEFVRHITIFIGYWKELESLPDMPQIKHLVCQHNKLTSLSLMPNLEYLDCSHNLLTKLSFYPKLKHLSCQYNQLTDLPPMPKLDYLDCNTNRLIDLPILPSLKFLRCDNTIKNIPKVKKIFVVPTSIWKEIKPIVDVIGFISICYLLTKFK